MTHSRMHQNCLDKSKLHYHACLYLSPSWALSWCWGHNVWAQFLTSCSPLSHTSLWSGQCYHASLCQKALSFLARSLCARDVHAMLTSISYKLHVRWGKVQTPACFGKVPGKPWHADLEARLSHMWQVLDHPWYIGSRGKALPNLNSNSGLFLCWQAKE